jgi:hypothetical protein
MSTIAHPSALGGPSEGGAAARRAIIRWAGRMLRREWRQQLLVVTLLTVAVAAAVGSITTALGSETRFVLGPQRRLGGLGHAECIEVHARREISRPVAFVLAARVQNVPDTHRPVGDGLRHHYSYA